MAPRDEDEGGISHADLYARIAVLETRIEHLRETVAAGAVERGRILIEIAQLNTLVAGIKGAWRVIGAAAGVVGILVGAVLPTVVRQLMGG
ncbi:MAG: hypothetical protein AB7P02_19330 [Alphaproteobacteria bacterium]